jgi:hypothetical protein
MRTSLPAKMLTVKMTDEIRAEALRQLIHDAERKNGTLILALIA